MRSMRKICFCQLALIFNWGLRRVGGSPSPENFGVVCRYFDALQYLAKGFLSKVEASYILGNNRYSINLISYNHYSQAWKLYNLHILSLRQHFCAL